MKDQQTVQQFIELRSKGFSFARISEQLGVARSTLVNWSREHQHVIQNLRAIEWEAFVDQALASKQERLQRVSEQLRKVEAELAQRELATVPTQSLQHMAEQLRRRIDKESQVPMFTHGVELRREDDTRPAIENWCA